MSSKETALPYIDRLKRQKEIIEAKLQKAEALHNQKEKKQDTRRKILIGAHYLEKARQENTVDVLYQSMEQYLKRNSDRKLFGLQPIDEEKILA